MYFIPRHYYRAYRRHRAQVLTCAAPYTQGFVDHRHSRPTLRRVRINRSHGNGPRWTLARTLATACDSCGREATVEIDMCATDMYRRFFSLVDFYDGAGRADLAATGTFRATIAMFIATWRHPLTGAKLRWDSWIYTAGRRYNAVRDWPR